MFTTSADGQLQWREVGSNTACDVGAGEVALPNSPGKGLDLEQCKQACRDAAGCQSITYFNTGWCSHFSTSCSKTAWAKHARSYRLGAESESKTTTTSAAAPTVTDGQF